LGFERKKVFQARHFRNEGSLNPENGCFERKRHEKREPLRRQKIAKRRVKREKEGDRCPAKRGVLCKGRNVEPCGWEKNEENGKGKGGSGAKRKKKRQWKPNYVGCGYEMTGKKKPGG